MILRSPIRTSGPLVLASPFARLAVVFLFLSAPFLVGFGPPGITFSDSVVQPLYPSDLAAMLNVRPPVLTATAALIMDGATGKVVFEKQSNQRRAPASITKIMTALVALEKGKLTDKVTVPRINLSEESTMGLLWGDVLTLEDLLWGLLLPSGNDAADVIAYHIGGGSVEAFVGMMNQKALQLGLKDTRFMNPHGLDEEGHYSSAYDLAVIARNAMNIPLFAQIVGTRYYTVRASRIFYLANSNFLLRPQNQSIGADGIKTGYTDDAGDSIVASATRDGRRVIVVALDTADRTAEAIRLFNYAFQTYEWLDLSLPPYLVASDGAGQHKPLMLKDPRYEYMPTWQTRRVLPVLKFDRDASVLPGKTIGSVSYTDGQTALAEIPFNVR